MVFDSAVTIASKDPDKPATLTGLTVNGSQGLTFSNLHMDFSSPWTVWNAQVVDSKNIVLNNLDFHGSMNGNPADDQNALLIRNSTGVKVTGSEFQEFSHGVSMMNSNDVRIEGNSFHDLRSDGVMSAGTSKVQVIGNTFTDFYPANGDHPDAIQFLTRGTTAKAHDILVSDNLIMRGDGGIIQGVFITDQIGLGYDRVTVSDNVIVGGMYNGIMVSRANGLVIDGNIVAAYGDQKSWIRVSDTTNAQLTDNEAQSYVLQGNTNLTQKGDTILQALSADQIANLTKWLAAQGIDPGNLGGGEAPSVIPGGDNNLPGKVTMQLEGGVDDYQVHYLGSDGVEIVSASERHEVANAGILRFADGQINLNGAGNLVDPIYYALTNRDVFAAGVSAGDHYANYGWLEGRDPNAWFSTDGYLKANPSVAASHVNPLLHYEQTGWREGRDPSAAFDNEYYLTQNPDVAASGMNPLVHYLQYGQAEGREIFGAIGKELLANSFDSDAYILANPDVATAGVNAYTHWATQGWKEGRDPNAAFDTTGYLTVYNDVGAGGGNPLDHYDAYGWREGRDPSATFDTSKYLAANPDVAAAGVNPLWHYLTHGVLEGRASYASDDFAGVQISGASNYQNELIV
ncbi:MAG: hypothetical protein C0481_02435 [Phenylobacterium sp.]|nr:hypothetical protein [Phenylobacterium sp.]